MIRINKVVKLALICEQVDKDGNAVDYLDVFKILWELQKQTRILKNKTIQLCWEYYNFSSEYYRKYNEYPKDKDILSSTLCGYIDAKLRVDNDLYSGNCSSTIRGVNKEFNNSKLDFIKGTRSIINYKSNQPLCLHKKCIEIRHEGDTFYADLSLLKRDAFKKYNFANSKIHFKVCVKDRSTQTILERCVDKIYGISESKLIYNQKKKQWFLNLSYSFEVSKDNKLDPDKILGVDLGVACPLCASVYGSFDRLAIKGGEIEDFRKKVEGRKKSLLRQGANCGMGRRGHGIHTRNKPAYNIEDKIARFRDTKNHVYSHDLIQYAIKNGCGTIQMEDLKGITEKANRFLKKLDLF